jgi:orotate phosphoribosyltransferase
MNADSARSRLLDLFKSRAFSFGEFTLASGKESGYYINSKKALFHSEAISLLAEILFDMSKDLNLDAVGGLEVGAIPMAAALAQRYHQQGRQLEGLFGRSFAPVSSVSQIPADTFAATQS